VSLEISLVASEGPMGGLLVGLLIASSSVLKPLECNAIGYRCMPLRAFPAIAEIPGTTLHAVPASV
jgi:hypothetical protein